ncbi:AAA-like domain-containing protein [Microcystis aeruginosa CS-564/01]|uniref:AAA-like domain-containing protein n=1 Tax=Microcystis aeruginosa TaxID=1126 RepID=UPI00232E0D06|nr:AAA-like domain-containing protein [Microcystis aeruginosa]MDB9424640.1 AAA-like domain-containing protein [Microcystis aeruginosa CS-564/01]
MSRKVTYGDIPRQRTKYLLNALLKFANYEVDNCENLAIKFSWINEKKLKIQAELNALEMLTEKCGQKLESWQIRDALTEYLNEKFLGILEDHRLNNQGKIRTFQITFWQRGHDILTNLRSFDQEWANKSKHQSPAIAAILSSLDEEKQQDYQTYIKDYVKRPPLEENCLKVLQQEQSLLRIRAPHNSGKTRLVNWLVHYLKQDNYQPVIIDCEEEKATIALSCEDLLLSICRTITQELKINESLLDKFWSRPGTPAHKTRRYLEEYVLQPSANPLVFVFEKFDTILETETLGNEICGILRSWHERRSQPWRKLRLIIIHSTEFYSNYDFYASPLIGVGYVASLSDFNTEQVLSFAQVNGINWTLSDVNKVMNLVGGNPYLIKLILVKLQEGNSLEKVLDDALQGREPFQSHFFLLMRYLKSNANLQNTFRQILQKKALTPAQMKGESVQFLERLGLIDKNYDTLEVRCNLYQVYFDDLLD